MLGKIRGMNSSDLAQLLDRFARPGLPKYTALHDAVLHAVAVGHLKPGARVPNEQDLAQVLPLSLGTIQRALRQLVQERVIERRPGQGSYISDHSAQGQMEHPFHCRFLDDTGKRYLPVFPEVLSRERIRGQAPWSAHLRCDDAVVITRKARIADEFCVHTTFAVDAARLPVFSTMSVRQLNSENFKHIIFRTCGQAIHKVDILTRQEVPPLEVRRVLGVGAKTPCLSLRSLAFLGESSPIYYQHIFVPPTDRELHIVTDSREPGYAA